MYCHKCGNELKDGAVFCGRCGSPVKNRPAFSKDQGISSDEFRTEQHAETVVSESAAETTPKKKKKGIGLGFILLALVISAGALYWFVLRKTTINLNDYLEIKYSDYLEKKDARVGFKVRTLINDYEKAFAITDKRKTAMREYLQDTFSYLIMDTMVDAAVQSQIMTDKIHYGEDRTADQALIELFLLAALADNQNIGGKATGYFDDDLEPEMIKAKLDKNTGLSDGERINLNWEEIDAKAVEEVFAVKLKYSNTSFVVGEEKSNSNGETNQRIESTADIDNSLPVIHLNEYLTFFAKWEEINGIKTPGRYVLNPEGIQRMRRDFPILSVTDQNRDSIIQAILDTMVAAGKEASIEKLEREIDEIKKAWNCSDDDALMQIFLYVTIGDYGGGIWRERNAPYIGIYGEQIEFTWKGLNPEVIENIFPVKLYYHNDDFVISEILEREHLNEPSSEQQEEPSPATSETTTAPATEAPTIEAPTTAASTTAAVEDVTGEVDWNYNKSSKTLTISGKGKMEDYGWWDDTPWIDCRDEIEQIVIEEGVTSVGKCAFSFMWSLKAVKLPSTLKSLEYWSFHDCQNLISISFGGTSGQWANITKDRRWNYGTGDYAILCSDKTLAKDPIILCGDNATWSYDAKTKTLTISGKGEIDSYNNGGEPWENYNFEIKKVLISEGISGIGSIAFPGMYNCTEVNLPASLQKVGSSIFNGSSNIKHIYYAGTKAEWNRISKDEWTAWDDGIGTYSFVCSDGTIEKGIDYSCGPNATWSYDKVTDTLTISGKGRIENNSWDNFVNELGKEDNTWVYKKIIVEEGITDLGYVANYYADTIMIPASVTTWLPSAFLMDRSTPNIIFAEGSPFVLDREHHCLINPSKKLLVEGWSGVIIPDD